MPHIPKAVCVSCEREMVPEKNGIILEMMLPHNPQQGYYKISTASSSCPPCDDVVLISFASQPIAEHFEEGYDTLLPAIQAEFA